MAPGRPKPPRNLIGPQRIETTRFAYWRIPKNPPAAKPLSSVKGNTGSAAPRPPRTSIELLTPADSARPLTDAWPPTVLPPDTVQPTSPTPPAMRRTPNHLEDDDRRIA